MRWLIAAGRDASDRDIVARREVVAHEILEDDADAAAQVLDVVFAEVMTVEQYTALVRVVQAGQQLHQRGLARAVLADQRHDLPRPEREAQMAHRPVRGAGIDETDILEDETLAQRPGQRSRVFGRQDPSLTVSRVEVSAWRVWAGATGTSRCASDESDDQALAQGGDRVRNVTLGSDRWRLWVGNRRENQVARVARRHEAPRGNCLPLGDRHP